MMLYATRAYKPCVQISTPPSQPIMLKKKCANTQMRIYYKHKSHFPGTKKMKFGCFTIFVGGRGIHQNTDSAYLLKVRVAVFYLNLLQIMLLCSKCFLTRSAPLSSWQAILLSVQSYSQPHVRRRLFLCTVMNPLFRASSHISHGIFPSVIFLSHILSRLWHLAECEAIFFWHILCVYFVDTEVHALSRT